MYKISSDMIKKKKKGKFQTIQKDKKKKWKKGEKNSSIAFRSAPFTFAFNGIFPIPFFSLSLFFGETPPSPPPPTPYRTPIDKTRIGGVLVREVSSDRVGIRPRGKANVRKRGRENRTFRARALLYPLPPRRRVRFVSLQSRLAPRAGSMRFIASLRYFVFFLFDLHSR